MQVRDEAIQNAVVEYDEVKKSVEVAQSDLIGRQEMLEQEQLNTLEIGN